MQNAWIEGSLIALTSLGSAGVALAFLWYLIGRPARARLHGPIHSEVEEAVFLFDDEYLVDATRPARTLLEAAPIASSDWARLTAFVGPRFADFAGKMAQLSECGRLELTGTPEEPGAPPLRLIAEYLDGLARITLIDPTAEGQGVLVDGLSQRALEDELEQMRLTLDRAPALIWRSDPEGTVVWANRAYILKSGAFDTSEEGFIWPLPRLFDLDGNIAAGAARRVSLSERGGTKLWFDCYSYPVNSGIMHFALPADATVRAEKALREFVQTLTKTFADLPVGLAVFDRQRQLQLFNPALSELLNLGPEFLSSRPSLYAFLDRLRETRMMPEPKDYKTWRAEMTELEQAAATGFHAQTWNLPSGQTYRVTGRPHPDGAVAFLFEDISAETSLTRRFRAELEMSEEVLDLVDDAVAVFKSSGELALSNKAYGTLWRVEPETTLGQIMLGDAVQIWQADCEPTGLWAKLREMANRIGTREMFEDRVVMRNGQQLNCRIAPLSGGALMVRFAAAESARVTHHSSQRKGVGLIAQG